MPVDGDWDFRRYRNGRRYARRFQPRPPSPPRIYKKKAEAKPKTPALRGPRPVFVLPLKRVLAIVQPDMKISKKTLAILNGMMVDLLDRLALAAMEFRKRNYRFNRMMVLEAEMATRTLIQEGKLRTNACNEGSDAWVRYYTYEREMKRKRRARQN